MTNYSAVHLYLVATGAAIFISLYLVVKCTLSSLSKFSDSKGANRPGYGPAVVAEKSVSVLAGFLCSATGVYIIWEVDDIIHGKSKILLKAGCLIYWYFIQDTFSMFVTFCYSRNCKESTPLCSALMQFITHKPLMLFHHLVFIVLTIPFTEGSMRNHFGDWYVGFLFLMEVSTPFLALHYIFEIVGLKDSLVQQINGIVFIIIFFVVRIATFPYMYFIYAYKYHSGDIISAVSHMYWFCHCIMLAGFLMQMFWFVAAVRKVLRGVTRIYHKDHLD